MTAAAPPIGHNNPPLDAFAAISADIDDLDTEAKLHLDGEPVTTQAQADALDALIEMALRSEQASEAARKEARAPHDAAVKEIQDAWNPLTATAKRIKETARAAVTAWKVKLDNERKAKAAEAERVAQAARDAANAAAQEARRANDLAAIEAAEAELSNAAALEKDAAKAAKPVATGLRTKWEAVLNDRNAALKHYLRQAPAEFEAVIQRMADQDARAGIRSIPGFDVVERKVAL